MAANRVKTDKPFTVFSVEADKDYLLARLIAASGAAFQSRAGYFAHQACEKYLKAFTVQAAGEYLQTHQLRLLSEACGKFDPYFLEATTLTALGVFDDYEQVGRYGAAANFDPKAQTTEGVQTAGVSVWSSDYVFKLDWFVHNSRAKLDHKTVGYDDGLLSILRGNDKSYLAGTWKGQPALRDVLTRANAYFRADG